MKILFIENRHKTFFYEPIARQLQADGNKIYWIIQNKEFVPSLDSVKYTIPYPKEKIKYQTDKEIEEIIKIDRQFNHFNQKDSTYFYYYNERIRDIIEKIMPDIVFGESTAFHELLTILNCKKLGILYLNPSSCRYPIGRFSFYEYDTLIPFKGSGEVLQKKDAEYIIDQIVNRTAVPDYMKLTPPSKLTKIKDKLLKVKSYMLGEKYNTPNPFLKYKSEKQKKQINLKWDEASVKEISDENSFTILYPLQMQPEANIDVWGKEYRDQTNLISKIADSLSKDCKLIVKPNPKSNYEISEELITLATRNKQIEILHHFVKMDNVLPKVDLVITVTGTIAIECILSNKPVITLVDTINNKVKSCIYIESIIPKLSSIIEEVKKDNFPKLLNNEKVAFINSLNKSSFEGKVSDPLTDESCILENNIHKMATAFRYILYAI